MEHAFVYSENMGNFEPYNCWDGDILSLLDFPMESLEGGDDDDHHRFIVDWDSTNYGPIPSHDTDWKQKQTNRDLKTQSPVSVIESNGSTFSSSGKIKRARSKRARPSGLSPWLLMSPPFAKTSSHEPSVAKKSIIDDMDSVTKRCGHCQVTQTPQWRGGPMGPKTLCNACGVRYRSGRLLPEYRPAASPTFVSSLHSNSHKKVVEMRNRVQKGQVTRNEQDSMYPEMEFVPMSRCLFDSTC